jgi:hypothetical protein
MRPITATQAARECADEVVELAVLTALVAPLQGEREWWWQSAPPPIGGPRYDLQWRIRGTFVRWCGSVSRVGEACYANYANRAGCWLTASRREPQESATENNHSTFCYETLKDAAADLLQRILAQETEDVLDPTLF